MADFSISQLTEDVTAADSDLVEVAKDNGDGTFTSRKQLRSTLVSGKADQADLDTHEANTSNPHSVTKDQVGLSNVPNTDATQRTTHTGSQAANTISDFASAADARIAAAAGVSIAELSGGKVPTSQLPAIALTSVQTAGSEAAMLALTTQEGDVVVRTDENKTYVRNAGTAGTMADFTHLNTPTDAVSSVNGQTGDVVLGKSDVGLSNVNNTADTEKPVSTPQQDALNTKADASALTSHTNNTENPHGVTKSQVGLGDVANLKINLAATAAPTVNDDSGDGYAIGSRWIDTTADKEYVCLDATSGVAVWTETTGAGGGAGGSTNLSASRNATSVTVESDTGTDATLAAADATNAGVMTAADRQKIDGVEPGAQVNEIGSADIADFETTTELNARDTANRSRSNHTGSQTASTISDFASATDARISAAAGVTLAELSGGKVPTSQLPAVSLTSVQTAVDEAAQLALSAQAGDVVVRTDENKTYMHNGGTAGTMADFTLLNTPTDAVTSVNSQTGDVVLGKGDVGLGNVDNTSDANKPVSTAQQDALDAKAADADVVHDTGDETIVGVKTFSNSPVVPTPTTDMQAATKKYVDDNAGGGGGGSFDINNLSVLTFFQDTGLDNYVTASSASVSQDTGFHSIVSSSSDQSRVQITTKQILTPRTSAFDRKTKFLVAWRRVPNRSNNFVFRLGGSGASSTIGSVAGIGIANDSGNLVFFTADGSSNTTTVISAEYAAETYDHKDLTFEFNPGVDCKFYINGVLTATHTTTLPSGDGSDNGGLFGFYHLSGPSYAAGRATFGSISMIQDAS